MARFRRIYRLILDIVSLLIFVGVVRLGEARHNNGDLVFVANNTTTLSGNVIADSSKKVVRNRDF